MGDDSIINAGALIGSDGFGYRITKRGLQKIPHVGIVRIGRGVEVGGNASIDRAAFDATVIGDGVKLDNMVHIAHNVHIGAHTAILAQTAVAGSVRIGMGCLIGAHVVIKDHVTLGNKVRVVSKAGVMRDTPDNQTVAGVPAMPFLAWKRLTVFLANFQDFATPLAELKNFLAARAKRPRWWKWW